MKVRSRVANLGDLRNPSLRQNVISGAITPSQIAVMTTEVGGCVCVCVCVCVCGCGCGWVWVLKKRRHVRRGREREGSSELDCWLHPGGGRVVVSVHVCVCVSV